MSGHSKWANIKHRKSANDAKKGKLYTKLIKEITVAVKEKGDNIAANPRLKLAIQNAKGANVPKDNIERAVKKAAGGDAENYIDISYEGYAPAGVAVIVECTTDNTNRTVSSVRSIFSKHGGSLTKNGSLKHLFTKNGIFIIKKDGINDEDDITLKFIDLGIDDVSIYDDEIFLSCPVAEFGSVQKGLEYLNLEVLSSEIIYSPSNTISLGDAEYAKVFKLINALNDDDDVQNIYHNLEIDIESNN